MQTQKIAANAGKQKTKMTCPSFETVRQEIKRIMRDQHLTPGKARKKQQKSEKRKEFLMLIRQPGLLFAIIFVFAVLDRKSVV